MLVELSDDLLLGHGHLPLDFLQPVTGFLPEQLQHPLLVGSELIAAALLDELALVPLGLAQLELVGEDGLGVQVGGGGDLGLGVGHNGTIISGFGIFHIWK